MARPATLWVVEVNTNVTRGPAGQLGRPRWVPTVAMTYTRAREEVRRRERMGYPCRLVEVAIVPPASGVDRPTPT